MSRNDQSIGSHAKFITATLNEQMRAIKLHAGRWEIAVTRTYFLFLNIVFLSFLGFLFLVCFVAWQYSSKGVVLLSLYTV